MSTASIIHVYPQQGGHGEAVIVADPQALTRLAGAIARAQSTGRAAAKKAQRQARKITRRKA